MHLAMRRDDVAAIVEPAARRLAEQLVAKQTNRIDVPKDLSLLVPTAIVTNYFGIVGAQNNDLIDWATLMFWYLSSISLATRQSPGRRSMPRPPAVPPSMPQSRAARPRVR